MAATYVLARGTAPLADAGERQEAIRAAMVGAIQELRDHGHTVVLVYPVPEAGWFVRHRVAKLLRRGASLDTIISWVSTNHPVVQTRLRDSYAGTTTTSSASTLNSCCAGRGKQGVAKP
jgi:hypothetical protein